MKILVSPAKLMDLTHQNDWNKNTKPQFLDVSEQIMNVLKNQKSKDLQNLMHISNDIAEMNVERNTKWKNNPTKTNSLNAILAFKGEVYRGLDAENLSDEAKEYLNKNLFILSGLYGILRPSDRIMLYRLEMGTKLGVDEAKNLYQIWNQPLTDFVNSKTKKNEVILNLASNEYSKAILKKELKANLVEVDFLDYKDGELKKIMMYFKHARGEMAKWCAENNVSNIEQLKLFNVQNYQFDENLSKENHLVFTR